MGKFKQESLRAMFLALMVIVASGVYTYKKRYFFVFMPHILSAADITNTGNWLLPRWLPGLGHSAAEFFNQSRGKWQLVDSEHAGTACRPSGGMLDIVSVLGAFRENRQSEIMVDYGPYRDSMPNGARGLATQQYFFWLNYC